jgi:hypothetical protein
MKLAAGHRRNFWTAIALFSAILLLPWGNLVLAAPTHCCGHCGSGAPGISSGNCCQPGYPGRCGSSGQTGSMGCQCRGSGNLVAISLPAVNAPTWQVSSYALPPATIFLNLFPPSIFHPPEQYLFPLV